MSDHFPIHNSMGDLVWSGRPYLWQLGIWLTGALVFLLTGCTQSTSPASLIPPTAVTPAPMAVLPATQIPTRVPTATGIPTPYPTYTPALTSIPTRTETPTTTPTEAPTSTATPHPTPSATPVLSDTPLPPPMTKALVLIIIDGARWSETFGEPSHQFIPHLANGLAPLGAINTAFYNDATTLSVPGHAAIVTGTWQDLPNDGTVRPRAPTIFEYFRRATGVSEDEAVFVHGSFIEPVLTHSTHPDYGSDFGARMFFSDYPTPPYDDGMWANAKRVLAELQPRLLMISLLDPDETGHERQWDGYRQAIKHDDEIIWDLWQQLQTDSFYAGQTTLLVTNDHGRGCGDDWPNHGGTDACNRHVMFLAVGPDIQPGLVIAQRRTLRDIAPTVGYLLGFDTPFAEGELMTELLAQ